ncbi:hypothetical protein LLE49_24790 [Alicyclobacillus tolerans]|uniref:hypothetical protein n=1 Tax=Alicyclobacillus tolerans TaxID=90970 RepID=UPI001F30FDE3|nr:hypothetical protein [Alicyclobacillus tolerans]MCF8567945.1 hypothetical protein [Alicyclobacillus tolerans]
MEDKREYRIPKHIDQKLRLAGLDVKGWLIVGSLGLLGLIALLLFPHYHIKTLLFELIGFSFPALVAWIFLSDERTAETLFLTRYYHKNKAILRWESDPNAFLEQIETAKQRDKN